jgi:hypothetical protein
LLQISASVGTSALLAATGAMHTALASGECIVVCPVVAGVASSPAWEWAHEFQQGMLAISPQMKLILWGTPVGLCGIASLLLFLSYVEFGAAKQADSAGLWECGPTARTWRLR